MRRSRRRALFASVVALVLFALTATSGARTFQLSETTFRDTFRSLEFIGGSGTINCPVTLEGSFHSSSISKVSESLIGHITRASVSGGSCTGGAVTVLAETLPWHVRYAGFEGTLPEIRKLLLRAIGMSFRVQPTGSLACLLRSEAAHPATLTYERATHGEITGVTASNRIPATGEGGLCAFGGEVTLGGTAATTVLGETTPIAVFLGEEGSVLEGERQNPPPALNIPRERVVGTQVLANAINVPVKVKAIFTFGENDELFTIKGEEARACRNEMVLRANGANNCNIVVEYVGPPIPRVRLTSTSVVIAVRVGKAELRSSRFAVNAQ